ncbi:autotransporter domain-containing protein [Labrys monachus]|uniref:Outer membrane autotransporter protein n=1 Tax=Labrys monachus TaxID=217067 RepID=A0ABU0F7R2_9HYPH|nr:autotransporter domain-containing protein [Labrys monachus]MDQ0390654.1 outer membrane autotransporter protein [Labrys monachus]
MNQTLGSTPIVNSGNGWDPSFDTVTKSGTGTLTIDGGTITGGETYITGGAMAQTSGTTHISYLAVGTGAGNTGTLNVSGGSLTFGTGLQVGDFGGTGTVNQTGGTVTVEQDCGDPTHCATFNIGNQGGNGTYNISGAGSVLNLSGGIFVIGRNDANKAASTGLLNLNGGTVSVSAGELIIGDNLVMGGGTSNTPGSGTITQTAGTLSIGADASLNLSGSGNGVYNLDGGTLAIGGTSLVGHYGNMAGTYAFNLGGGTVRVTGSALTTDVDATLVSGTNSTIDTNGLGAAWSGIFSGNGALTKAGAGTLTLSGVNTYTGGTTVSAGTLALSGAGTVGTGRLTLGAGTIFDISATTSGATVGSLAGSGTIENGTKSLVVGGDNTDSSFSGTIDNTNDGWQGSYGTFTKTGSGTLTIDGATINHGEAYINGGAMAQTSGTTQISYLAVGEGTGHTGNLNISGGSLTFTTGLQVGDFGGTGTVTQSGGTVLITDGCGTSAHCALLNIGNQGGTGIYNLQGGTLTLNDGMFDIGRNTTGHSQSTGTLNISGGELDLTNTGLVTTELVIGDSSAADPGTAGTGKIVQTGGVLSVANTTTLYLSGYGNGEYDLDGGILKIGGSSLAERYGGGAATGTYVFNWNDGGIQVTGSALATDVDATLGGSGPSIIDTNGLGATWTGVLSGSGKLAKIGDGTLTLSGANTYQGGTVLQNGTIAVGNDTALGTGVLEMAAGTTLDFTAGTYTVANDIVIDGDPTVNVGTGLTDTLSGVIGDGTPAGDIVKTGDGTLILSGLNTYTGSTTVSGGTLALSGLGSIAASSGLALADGTTFDISATTAGASIKSLSGTGAVDLGAEFLTLTDAHDTYSGTIGGTGGLTLSGGSEVLNGTNTYTGATTVTGAALELDGSVTSAVTLGSGGILSGTGTIGTAAASPADGSLDAQAGSIVRPGGNGGADIGTLTVNGDFTQESGSTYEAQVGAGGIHDLIAVSGVATIQSNATLSIATSPNGLVDVPLNTPITVLTAAGGVVGQYDTFVGTAFYGVTAGYDDVGNPHAITETVTQDRAFAAAGVTRNEIATAAGLDSLPGDNNLHNVIGSLTSDADARSAFNQLSGEAYASTKSVLIGESDITRDAVTDRLRQALCDTGGSNTGIRSNHVGPQNDPFCEGDGVTAWGRAYGSWGHVDGDGNAATVDHSIGGVLLGIDTRVFDTWRVGILGGYGQSDFSIDGRNSSGSSDDYNVGLYAGNQWGPLGLRTGGSYTWHTVSTDRYVVLPDFADTLHGKYDAATAQVFGDVGYKIDAGTASFEPFAGLAYVNLHTDGFTEKGGEAALTARSSNTGVTFSTLGMRGSLAFDLSGIGMTANGTLGWRHAFGNITPTSTFTVDGSSPFSVAGVPIAQDAAVVEAGLGAAVTQTMTVDIAYTGQFGKDTQDQGVHGTVGWKF